MLSVTGEELREAVRAEKDLESELLRLVVVNWQPSAGPGARRDTLCVVRLMGGGFPASGFPASRLLDFLEARKRDKPQRMIL